MKNPTPARCRHDLSDETWAFWSRICRDEGAWGGIAEDNRPFINAVFWIMRTGAPWRDLPPDYDGWSNAHRRFIRWRDKGVWEKLLEILIDEPDDQWLMIDASYCNVHPHATGAVRGNQAMSRIQGGSTPRYLWLWRRRGCRSELLLQKVPGRIAHKPVA